MPKDELTPVTAIKKFFETEPHGRRVALDELKALSVDDRYELGNLAKAELDA